MVLLALQDALDERYGDDGSNVFQGEIDRPLFRVIIQSQAFSMRTEPTVLMTRHRLRWYEIAAALADRADAVDLPAVFEEATGVPLDDVTAVAVVLWAAAVQNGTIPFNLATGGLKWERGRIERALALISATPGSLERRLLRWMRSTVCGGRSTPSGSSLWFDLPKTRRSYCPPSCSLSGRSDGSPYSISRTAYATAERQSAPRALRRSSEL